MMSLLSLSVAVVSDSAQYFVGPAIRPRPLAPRVSPGKTIKGA